MKLLYIANARIPTEKAHGVQIMKMCEALSDLGHEVTLLVPRRLNAIKENPFAYYAVRENFRIVYVPTLDLVYFGRVGFWLHAALFAALAALYASHRVFGSIYSRDELPLFLLSLFCREPLAWESHVARWNALVRFLARRGTAIIAISQGIKDEYLRRGVPARQVFVAHDGVDLAQFSTSETKASARARLGLPLDVRIAMYIGRLDRWKGVETLLKAGEILGEKAHIAVIGEGGEEKRLMQAYPHALFLGPRPYRDLPVNQKAADVLVIPNSGKSAVSRNYTSPLKVFAHMASGVPIVASDLPSIREALNEHNAMLVAPDDPSALADGIRRVFREPVRAAQNAARAVEDAARYSWEARARATIEFLRHD